MEFNDSQAIPVAADQGNTKSLIDNAVCNTSIFSKKGFLDRLFARWFNRLVYPQIWEDPEVDIEALNLNEHSKIFTISSGGCNALNYLTEHPESVTVVDLNEAHIALIKLKLTATKQLSQKEFFQFFAQADTKDNIELYKQKLQQHLDDSTSAYWDQPIGLFRKPRIQMFAENFYTFGLLGQFIGLIHWVGRRLGYDISKVMEARNLEEQQTLFNQHVAPLFHTRLIKFLSRRSMVMYSLGIPPSQFTEMESNAQQNQQSMHELLEFRARRLACDFPLETNYFAWQAYGRKYDTQFEMALPRYLQSHQFSSLQTEVAKVHVFHQSMTERLKNMDDNSLNAYLFLDAQDWMNPEQLTELWQEVNRTAEIGARVVFRTAGEHSPLEDKLSPSIIGHWITDTAANRTWTAKDRSSIYGGVHMYEKIA